MDETEAVLQKQSGMYWRNGDPDLEMCLEKVLMTPEKQQRILINLCHFHPWIFDGSLTPIWKGGSRSRRRVAMLIWPLLFWNWIQWTSAETILYSYQNPFVHLRWFPVWLLVRQSRSQRWPSWPMIEDWVDPQRVVIIRRCWDHEQSVSGQIRGCYFLSTDHFWSRNDVRILFAAPNILSHSTLW